MMYPTRLLMTGLLMAGTLALAPVGTSFASAPQYNTSNPTGTDLSGQALANVMNMNSLNIGIMNGFNPQQMLTASVGGMIGDALTNAMGIDGMLGDLIKVGITVGVAQGLDKITGGQMNVSMGNFGAFGSTALTSQLLGGNVNANNFGAFATGAITAGLTAVAGGQTDVAQVATAAAVGGMQGAIAQNTASLNP